MPRLEHDDDIQDFIEDDEGNKYTPEQVRAATEAMVKDESGEGSMGGLAEDDEENLLPTTPAGPKRELNPANFGDFFKSNIFGGLDAKYVTGKRPMTAFDYVTDAAAAYGGEDLGKRNANLVNTDIARQKLAASTAKDERAAALSNQRIKTSQAQERKTGLETDKLANEAVTNIMQNLDSDLWLKEMGAVAKEHGIQLRPGTQAMVQRMAEKLAEAGARSPGEVIENPDKFAPELVNRVRHTMTLLTKNIEESQSRNLEQEKSKQALGLRGGAEQRNQEKDAQSQTGLQDAIDLLTDKMADTDDPGARQQLKAKIATLRQGGTAAQGVLAEMSGTKPVGTGARGAEFQSYLTRAGEALPGGTPGQVGAKAQELKSQDRARSEMTVRGARALADKQAAVAQGISTLDQMATEIKKLNPGQSGFAGRVYTFLRQKGGRLVGDPQTAVVDSLAADMTNVARTLGGEKGPLTEGDIARVNIALQFRDGDTLESWLARYEKARRVAMAGQKAIEDALQKNLDTPLKVKIDDDLNIVGAGDEGAPAGDKQAMAAEIRSMPPGPERAAKAKEFTAMFGGK